VAAPLPGLTQALGAQMKVCGWKIQALTASAIACLNYFFALGTFGQLFACADMWGKCTPSSALTISHKILSLPLSLVSAPGVARHLGIELSFALNAAMWGLLSFAIMRLACHAKRT
jgi:hypothetical protein